MIGCVGKAAAASRGRRRQVGASGVTQVRAGADEVERRTGRARVLARRRLELARLDRRDRRGQLPPELHRLFLLVTLCYKVARALEELVDDLDLVPSRAQDRERVHEALEPVVALDDLLRRGVLEHVRLVVDDERLAIRLV